MPRESKVKKVSPNEESAFSESEVINAEVVPEEEESVTLSKGEW
ncbi:hypothetical protein [Calothrix sp. PCC 6303]|nr:hypothetical protein [Calothrix sp. PCC 6303]